jgi:hypothetical protein
MNRPAQCRVFHADDDPLGLDPVKRPLSERGPGAHLQAIEKARLRRLGQWALAGHLDVEIPLGLDGTQPGHPHPGPGNHRRPEMSVKLHHVR